MASYVEVPSAALFAMLEGCGFAVSPSSCLRGQSMRGEEVIYERAVDSRHTPEGILMVRVYTSVREGSGRARGRGRDAVRVTLSWASADLDEHGSVTVGLRSCGLYSQRVFRSGTVEGVLDRTRGRMREAWRLGATMRRCGRCAGPAWPDSGRCALRCRGTEDARVGGPR